MSDNSDSIRYFINTIHGREYICSSNPPLKVAIYYLQLERFTVNNKYIYLYGNDCGCMLAFRGSNGISLNAMMAAINWYKRRCPDVEGLDITTTDPRKCQFLYAVK